MKSSLSFVVSVSMLLVMLVCLTVPLWYLGAKIARMKPESAGDYAMAMIWLILICVILVCAFIAMVLLRRMTRLIPSKRGDVEEDQYVNAWEEAGRRFELPDDDEDAEHDGDFPPHLRN